MKSQNYVVPHTIIVDSSSGFHGTLCIYVLLHIVITSYYSIFQIRLDGELGYKHAY